MLMGQNSYGGRYLYPSLLVVFLLLVTGFFWSGKSHISPTSLLRGGTSPELLAVVIETDPPQYLHPLVLHFAAILGPQWKMVIYTLEENWAVPQSAPIQRGLASGSIEVRFLPHGTEFADPFGRAYSKFMSEPWIWEQLSSASRVLLFQTDSMICANSPRQVDDYLHYDYVGAPISADWGRGYNGGLSLRNPKLFLNITQENTNEAGEMEDQWFYQHLEARVDDDKAVLPSQEVARGFAVETIWYEKPLGYHQPFRFLPDRRAEIEAWCPETKMARLKF